MEPYRKMNREEKRYRRYLQREKKIVEKLPQKRHHGFKFPKGNTFGHANVGQLSGHKWTSEELKGNKFGHANLGRVDSEETKQLKSQSALKGWEERQR